ncbi:MAG TPA: glycoside hydrolase family 9 protein [Terriglobia bacterium]|nr:glycoside hydrolase family 9 protein [Terriglobia bacterium]
MKRRQFLGTAAVAPAVTAAVRAAAQAGPPVADPVEKMTAPERPTIAINHLGFRPRVGSKTLVVRALASTPPREYTLRDVSERHFSFTRPLTEARSEPGPGLGPDLGPCLTADFTDLDRPGLYQITVGGEHSVQFALDDQVWRRTLPKAVGYYRYQRCGVEVPMVHPACHLDDARRRDTGEHVDEVGGWHDAGDLRKWMDVTMLNGIALLNLFRNLPSPRPGDPTHEQILEEVRHGNQYFLKMQDADGKVWADVAGGVNGDNSDNHWTDNTIGTGDDRYINTAKRSDTAAVFAALQGLVGQCYAKSDPDYARQCLAAGARAWYAFGAPKATLEIAWWTVATCELFRATRDDLYRRHAMLLARDLLACQNTSFLGDQKLVRGFWMDGDKPYVNVVFTSLPPLALLELYDTFPDANDREKWKDAVALHLDEYLLPMAERNSYRIIPLSLFQGSPTPETYRSLAGNLTYRYFMPTRKGFWWQGTNSHLGGNALLLARFARIAGDKARRYVDLAYRQLEWVMGANPFGACLMTGEGMRNPYPHSRFVGLIPGGIMNGIAGNADDEPVLDTEYTLNWRTCEYWSPHVAFYIWANSVLEMLS